MNPLLDAIGGVLSYPGDLFRGGLNSLKGLVTGGDTTFKPTSGRELFGIEGDDAGSTLLGIGANLITDPLMLAGGLMGGYKLLKGLRGGAPVKWPLPPMGAQAARPVQDDVLTNVIRGGGARPAPVASPPPISSNPSAINLNQLMQEPDLAAALSKWREGMRGKPYGGFGDPSMFPPPPPIRGNWA